VYKTASDINLKIQDVYLGIISKNKYLIGLKWQDGMAAPKIIIKEKSMKLVGILKENNVPIICNKNLAEKLYAVDKFEYIPEETYFDIVKIIINIENDKEDAVKKSFGVIISRKTKTVVGFTHDKYNKETVIISFKMKNNINKIITICKKNNVLIKYNKYFAEYYFNNYAINDKITV
jgi:flagellar biosynthesis protein FlhB